MNVPNNTLKCSGLTEQKDGTELARAKGNRNIVPFRFRSVFPGNCSDWVLEHDLVAFGVLHVQSGRFDGWYFDHDEAEEMLDFFRNEFPGNEFELVGRSEGQPTGTDRVALRPHESGAWAVAGGGK